MSIEKKIKVLIIGFSENLGGIETYLYNLIINANLKKINFSVLTLYDNIPFENELKKRGINIIRIPHRKENYKEYKKQLKKIIESDYDIIHFNIMSYSWFEPIIYSKNSNARLIIHSHSSLANQKMRIKTKLLHCFGRLMSKRITCNRVACGEVAGNTMFDGKSYTILPNGVVKEKYMYNKVLREKIRSELNIGESSTVLGTISRVCIQKNTLFLLDIFSEYIKKKNDTYLVIVGDGELMEQTKNKIELLNLQKNVILTGSKYNANEYYSAFDLFILPSLYEGYPISIIEAQTNGLMCYASANMDKTVNITNNVKFLNIEKSAEYWAECIFKDENKRDYDAFKRIPDKYYTPNNYNMVYDFYYDILDMDV